jgi:DNA-directed RNA polymerase subunit RPC12/RpoP
MPYARHFVAVCSECKERTAVTEMYWPATRWDPADGEFDVNECSTCGKEFDQDTRFEDGEEPDPY